jgi:hypothetical protein
MNMVGTKEAMETQPGNFHRLTVASCRTVRYGVRPLNDDDCIVHDESNGQHQPNSDVLSKTKERKESEGADDDRYAAERDQQRCQPCRKRKL